MSDHQQGEEERCRISQLHALLGEDFASFEKSEEPVSELNVHEEFMKTTKSSAASALFDLQAVKKWAIQTSLVTKGIQRSNVGGFHSANDVFSSKYFDKADDHEDEEEEKEDGVDIEIVKSSLAALKSAIENQIILSSLDKKSINNGAAAAPAAKSTISSSSWWKDAECWVNVMSKGCSHAMHDHNGATWSGVYYIDAGGETIEEKEENEVVGRRTKVSSHRGGEFLARIECKDNGKVCEYASVEPATDLLLLFPSWLPHAVSEYKGERERISLSFNFFLGGHKPSSRYAS
jgi:hypothetical protein